MKNINENNEATILSVLDLSRSNLRADCGKCFGFCCVALYFSSSEGFPEDKVPGDPCLNLKHDFRCAVHNNLKKLGLRGCIAYDCFGAGQRVAMVSYKGESWRKFPEKAKQMYDVFLIMWQLHEMLWYLTDGITLEPPNQIKGKLSTLLMETENITLLDPEELLKLDVKAHRARVNTVLLKTSELLRNKYSANRKTPSRGQRALGPGMDLMGANLRRNCLTGANLRGSCLIAANLREVDLSGADLIGADLRDADIRGANLTSCLFLTQAQINSARGDSSTRLPAWLYTPVHWPE